MDSPVVGGLLTFAGGCAVAFVNDAINRRALKKDPSALAKLSFVRQILSIGYLLLVFFLSRVLPWDYVPLLVGAAVGLTVPAVILAFRLTKANDKMSKQRPEEAGKGADGNG